MSTERDRFLTEAIGLCWHTWEGTDGNITWYKCNKCGIAANFYKSPEQQNFTTWEGFGLLWEFAIKQDWWEHFIWNVGINKGEEGNLICESIINPDKFADAIYEFLKERK